MRIPKMHKPTIKGMTAGVINFGGGAADEVRTVKKDLRQARQIARGGNAEEGVAGIGATMKYVGQHPVQSAKAIAKDMVTPIATDVQSGNTSGAAGRVAVHVASSLLPTGGAMRVVQVAGGTGKAATLSRAAAAAARTADSAG